MDNLDAVRCAALLIKQYGDKALAHAERRQVELSAAGDRAGAEAWFRIEAAVRVLLKQAPDPRKGVH